MKKYSVVSLFSGAGGLDLGFQLTERYEILLANEILREPVQTYKKNFKVNLAIKSPSAEELPSIVLDDVEHLKFDALKNREIDAVIGGPPCQDFSIVRGPASERQGIEVKRGRLYTHFIRSLVQLQPKVFLFENVPGLKSVNKGTAWNTILEDFKNLPKRWEVVKREAGINNSNSGINTKQISGYGIIFNNVLNMSQIGVPQSRKRLIIVGIRKDLLKKNYDKSDLFEKAVLDNDSLLYKYPVTSIEIFEGRPLSELQNKYDEIMKSYSGIWDAVGTDVAQKWKKAVWDKLTFDVVKDYLAINKIEESTKTEIEQAMKSHKALLVELGYYKKRVAELNLSDGSNNNSREDASVTERMEMIPPDENHDFVRGTKWEVEGRGMSLIYRRLHPLKPAYTVVAYGGGGTWTYHYERKRSVLTNRERARLQTFPDDFQFKGSRLKIRAQVGEAVPPLVGKRIAQALLNIIEST